MKKIILPAALFFIFSITALVFAHPPTDIAITYNPETKILQAVITHNVSNPENHFIKKVDVALNGKEIIQHSLSRQDNFNTQTVSYLIPGAKHGDTLSVEAHCSISGQLEREIKL